MKHEDLAHLSTEALINIRETVSQVLEARDIDMQSQALLELQTIIQKWFDKGVVFYFFKDGYKDVDLYPELIKAKRRYRFYGIHEEY